MTTRRRSNRPAANNTQDPALKNNQSSNVPESTEQGQDNHSENEGEKAEDGEIKEEVITTETNDGAEGEGETPDTSSAPEKSEEEVKTDKGPFDHTIGEVTVENISKEQKPVDVNQGLTKVEIKYPEGYALRKHMPEGKRFVSKEVAEQFVKAGIATII